MENNLTVTCPQCKKVFSAKDLLQDHFKEKEKVVKSSITKKTKSSENNQVLETLNQHKKIKPYFKKIISLVRQVYDEMIVESKL